jgi:flagellar M-ring protein FliF
MGTLKAYLATLGPLRLAVLAAAIAGSLGFVGWVATTLAKPEYALLFGDLDMGDSARIVAQLEAAKTPYRLEAGGAAVFVPRDLVTRTRVALAEHAIPGGGSLGYEIFDNTSALGATNFIQNVNLVRALEGELARTIRGIGSVKNARVHLVLPKRELFAREAQPPSASVLLQMRASVRLSAAQVTAIQNLIAAAVPGLTPERIALVDGAGSLLTARAGSGDDGGSDGTGKGDERRLQLENRLARAVEQMVEKVVGFGKVRAEVAVEMDFDRINTSEEKFDPDGQVVRSTRTVEENGTNREGDGNQPVTVANSLPDASATSGGGGNASSETRNEEVVNYEISKKVINHVREIGAIRRMSVAVLVDGNYVPDAGGQPIYQPRPQPEIEQLAQLVRSAIGFNADRGDRIEVVNMRFAAADDAGGSDGGGLFDLDKNDLMRIGQYAGLLVLAILVLLVVIRPIVSRSLALAAPAAAARADQAVLDQGAQPPALTGPNGAAGTLAIVGGAAGQDGAILAQPIEDGIKGSTLKRIGEIVEQHPEETLAIVRKWLHADA